MTCMYIYILPGKTICHSVLLNYSMELPFPSTFFSFLFIVFLLVKLFNAFKSNNPSASILPPGPWKLPIIGSIHHLTGALPHRTLRDLAKKHGPLMHLKLGEVSAVVVSVK